VFARTTRASAAGRSGVSRADLRALGKKVIRAEDLADPPGPSPEVSRQLIFMQLGQPASFES
jgi:hypothetical protein